MVDCNLCTCDSSGEMARCTDQNCDEVERPEPCIWRGSFRYCDGVCEYNSMGMTDEPCPIECPACNAIKKEYNKITDISIIDRFIIWMNRSKRQVKEGTSSVDRAAQNQNREALKSTLRVAEQKTQINEAAKPSIDNSAPTTTQKKSSTPPPVPARGILSTIIPPKQPTVAQTPTTIPPVSKAPYHPSGTSNRVVTEEELKSPNFRCTPSESFKVDCNTCWCAASGTTTRFCTRIACKPQAALPVG